MTTTPRLVYWDACVFIKHLSPATDPKLKSILDGIDEVVDQAEMGQAFILTSSITRIEVLDCKIPTGEETKYLKFLRRELVQEFDVDPRISNAAHDIRAFYRKEGRDLGVADSIHVATACLREAEELFTLDGTGKKPGLIGLSGRIADRWDLTICAPRASMGRIFPLRAPDGGVLLIEEKTDNQSVADPQQNQTALTQQVETTDDKKA